MPVRAENKLLLKKNTRNQTNSTMNPKEKLIKQENMCILVYAGRKLTSRKVKNPYEYKYSEKKLLTWCRNRCEMDRKHKTNRMHKEVIA